MSVVWQFTSQSWASFSKRKDADELVPAWILALAPPLLFLMSNKCAGEVVPIPSRPELSNVILVGGAPPASPFLVWKVNLPSFSLPFCIVPWIDATCGVEPWFVYQAKSPILALPDKSAVALIAIWTSEVEVTSSCLFIPPEFAGAEPIPTFPEVSNVTGLSAPEPTKKSTESASILRLL